MKRTAIIATSVVLFFAAQGLAAHEGCITGNLSPGVTAAFKHKIIVEQETWPSALMETREGRAALELESSGGFRLHVRVRQVPGDYVVCVIYVDDGGRVVLDDTTTFLFHYDDRSVVSSEVLLTDSIAERKVWSTSEMTVVLTRDSDTYAKVRSGGFLAVVRFPKGSLPAGNDWVPGSFEMRGGERDAYAQGQSSARGDAASDVAARRHGG